MKKLSVIFLLAFALFVGGMRQNSPKKQAATIQLPTKKKRRQRRRSAKMALSPLAPEPKKPSPNPARQMFRERSCLMKKRLKISR